MVARCMGNEMLTIEQIDKIKKEIMRVTDITATYSKEEIAAFVEVFELAKERVISQTLLRSI